MNLKSCPIHFLITEPYEYEVMDDELLESEDLAIAGETPSCSSGAPDDLPVRKLRNFTIYDFGTKVVVPTGALTTLVSQAPTVQDYGASGRIALWFDYIRDEEDFETDSSENEDLEHGG